MACFCDRASAILGEPVRKTDIKSHKVVGSVDLPPLKIFQIQDDVWKNWKEISPTENDLVKSLNMLRESSLEIMVATSGPKRRTDFVQEWLRANRLPFDEFYALGPNVLKAKLQGQALVDDAPEQIKSFVEDRRVGFLYSQPWNIGAFVKDAIRISSIREVVKRYRRI